MAATNGKRRFKRPSVVTPTATGCAKSGSYACAGHISSPSPVLQTFEPPLCEAGVLFTGNRGCLWAWCLPNRVLMRWGYRPAVMGRGSSANALGGLLVSIAFAVWTSARRDGSIRRVYHRWRLIMKKLSILGIVVGAALLTATPFSLQWSHESNVALSLDRADARVGRPLTATSVAGVHRRAYRRAYRRGY
jgi:hypothetical protein